MEILTITRCTTVPISNGIEISHGQGVEPNTLRLYRDGGRWLMVWLDGLGNHEALIQAVPVLITKSANF
jgi:hypothetical protein